MPPHPALTPQPLPVRQASILPSASFRFHLAVNTLAVRLTLPLAGCVEDFHLQVISRPPQQGELCPSGHYAPCLAHRRAKGGSPNPPLANPVGPHDHHHQHLADVLPGYGVATKSRPCALVAFVAVQATQPLHPAGRAVFASRAGGDQGEGKRGRRCCDIGVGSGEDLAA